MNNTIESSRFYLRHIAVCLWYKMNVKSITSTHFEKLFVALHYDYLLANEHLIEKDLLVDDIFGTCFHFEALSCLRFTWSISNRSNL